MAVTNELKFPPTEELFEEMCFHLYKSEWKDPGANRLGGTGQAQKGLDSQACQTWLTLLPLGSACADPIEKEHWTS